MRDAFLAGMSHAASTVNVVTTDGTAGRAGVTVSAMSSVSADTPRPTLLVCIHHESPTTAILIENGCFCLNLLRDDQSYIADTFAGRFRDQVDDKFDCAEWMAMATGAPRVVDPLVGFDCRVVSSDRVGTHHVIIGEVIEVYRAQRGSPLIYANRSYGATSPIERTESIHAGRKASQRRLTLGSFHTFGPHFLPALLAALAEEGDSPDIRLVEGDQRRVQESLIAGETELALLYDFDLPESLDFDVLTSLTPYVLLDANHKLARQDIVHLQDLDGAPMVLLDAPPSRNYFLGLFDGSGVKPHVAYRSTSFEMVRGLVGQGLGYSLLATKPVGDVSYDGSALVARPLATDTAPSRLVLAYQRHRGHSPMAELFRQICKRTFCSPSAIET